LIDQPLMRQTLSRMALCLEGQTALLFRLARAWEQRREAKEALTWTELVYEGELKTTDELNEVFFSHGVSFDRPIIASCGSGVTAA
ncbi:hypothetical protein ONO57_25260, partial [Salmonella enterica subsp. enterica serovar Anatum]|nr:hypothetical protein [Salmonella enterica subsp. enterica serovar Anatum]